MRLVTATGATAAEYTYDAWGAPLTATGTMATINPIRYRGYYYDTESGFYYLQSRYYDPAIGRFINADNYASTGVGFLGCNMFTYCGNNPVCTHDPIGEWTIGLSLTANVTMLIGVSISIGVVLDGEGKIDVQWSYSVPTSSDTTTVGFLDAGVGASLQYTDAKTVDELLGTSTCIGASGGTGFYAGADAVSFSNASDLNGKINGVQLTAGVGVGVGVDVHVAQTKTKSLIKKPTNKRNIQSRRTSKHKNRLKHNVNRNRRRASRVSNAYRKRHRW